MPRKALLLVVCAILSACFAQADTISGYLNDNTNTNLIGSGVWSPGAPPPDFTDDWAIANNVGLYTIVIPAGATNATFDSNGFGMGGVDPYFTLFDGSGAPATFLGSNYAQAFSTGGDFLLSFGVVSGQSYTVAIGAFANMSMAENWGPPLTLGDGFTGLGVPGFLGSYYYELEISYNTPPIPEPGTMVLVGTGVLIAAFAVRRRRP